MRLRWAIVGLLPACVVSVGNGVPHDAKPDDDGSGPKPSAPEHHAERLGVRPVAVLMDNGDVVTCPLGADATGGPDAVEHAAAIAAAGYHHDGYDAHRSYYGYGGYGTPDRYDGGQGYGYGSGYRSTEAYPGYAVPSAGYGLGYGLPATSSPGHLGYAGYGGHGGYGSHGGYGGPVGHAAPRDADSYAGYGGYGGFASYGYGGPQYGAYGYGPGYGQGEYPSDEDGALAEPTPLEPEHPESGSNKRKLTQGGYGGGNGYGYPYPPNRKWKKPIYAPSYYPYRPTTVVATREAYPPMNCTAPNSCGTRATTYPTVRYATGVTTYRGPVSPPGPPPVAAQKYWWKRKGPPFGPKKLS